MSKKEKIKIVMQSECRIHLRQDTLVGMQRDFDPDEYHEWINVKPGTERIHIIISAEIKDQEIQSLKDRLAIAVKTLKQITLMPILDPVTVYGMASTAKAALNQLRDAEKSE